MVDQLSKMQILERMDSERQALLALLTDLTPEEMQQPGVVDIWSIKDVLAHLTAWEQLFLGWYQAGRRGETPEPPAPGFTWGWKSLDLLNQQIYERHRRTSLEEVVAMFQASYVQLVATAEAMTEAELHTPGAYAWTRKGSLAASLGANSYNHYRWAANLIKQWRRNERLRRSI